MVFNEFRIGMIGLVAIGVVLGLTFGILGIGSAALVAALGFGLAASLAAYWFYRKKQKTGEVDERHVQIQCRASVWTTTFFFVGLSVLSAVLIFTEVSLPVGLILVGFIFAGILVDELCIEVYKRRM